jgi:hypothetical protein
MSRNPARKGMASARPATSYAVTGARKKARQRPKPAAEPFRGRVSWWNTTRLNQDDKRCDGQIGEKVTKVDTARSPARTAALKSVLVRVADGYPDLARDSIGVVFPTD